MNSFEKYLDVLPEIQQALDENKPVVALESTILSHGMPYPENLDFAHRVEEVIRSLGGIPATCAIVKGRLKRTSARSAAATWRCMLLSAAPARRPSLLR